MSPEFWAGRRVLLTGHTGFKGSWLALWLLRAGGQVYGASPGARDRAATCFDQLQLDRGRIGGTTIADIRDLPSRWLELVAAAASPRWCCTWRPSRWCAAATATRWAPGPPMCRAASTCWRP